VKTPYVSIDLETTGLNPWSCQILEMAAIVENWKTDLDLLPTFHVYIVHEAIIGEVTALHMNAEIIKILAEGRDKHPLSTFLKPEEVMPKFAEFLKVSGVDPKHVTAAGKNFAGFDKPFLKRLMENWTDREDPVHFKHRVIDPAVLYWKPDEDDCLPSMQKCVERAGIPKRVSHRAVDDAQTVIELIRRGVK
jgi:DNA polymerase III epsilon subunit-like protein